VTVPQVSQAKASSPGARAGFWVVAVLGVVLSAIAWTWYGLAFFEAQTEQGKALSAGTTMAGTGELMGGVPVALAHVGGLITLLILGWKGYRARGIVLAFVAVLVCSAIGIGVAQVLWEGQLFQLGIDNDTYVP